MAEQTNHGMPAREGTRQALIYGGFFLFIICLITAPSAVIAFSARRWGPGLKRLEYGALAAGAVVVMIIAPDAVFIQPVAWLGKITTLVSGDWWPPPILGILVLATLYYGLAGVILSTGVQDHISGRVKHAIRTVRNPLEQNSLIPKEKEKANIRIASTPSSSLGVDARSHSIHRAEETPGPRSFAIGLDRNGRAVMISENEMGMHSMILGATGSGKTETIKAIAGSLMDLGWPGMVLDLKEDTGTGGLRDFLADYSASHALSFQEMALSDPNPGFWFNPLAGMGPDYARDTILSLLKGDDQYWQNINKKMLGQLVNLFYAAHEADPTAVPYPTIFDIGRVLGEGNLNRSTKKLRAVVQVATGIADDDRFGALANPSADEAKSAAGFGAKLTQIYETQAGTAVLRPSDAKASIDVTRAGVTYIGLDSTGKLDLSTMVSSAVLQRMSVYAAQRTTTGSGASGKRFLIIDEASVVNRNILKAMLSKARSAGIVVIVCTQGPEDWIDEDGDDWSEMAQNINVAFIMAQGSPHSAELCADFIGQSARFTVTQQTTEGEWTQKANLRENIDYLVQPHELRQLGIGELVLRVNKPKERVTWMAVKQRDPSHRIR